MSTPKVWFITGASSGFGLAVARHVLQNGDIVIATLRKPSALSAFSEQYSKDKLLVLKLDVSKPEEIAAAFAKAKDTFGRIDVVFNNAGYGVVGEFESTSDELARPLFDVDFWGAIHVTREAVKFFREVNGANIGGRIIQNSSTAGFSNFPGLSLYGAAKAALESVSEALAAELDPAWNIKISILEPGGFQTKGISNTVYTPAHPAYSNTSLQVNQFRNALKAGQIKLAGDPDKAAKVLYQLAQLSDPPLRVPLGKDSVGSFKLKLESLKKDLDRVESWSDGLELEQ